MTMDNKERDEEKQRLYQVILADRKRILEPLVNGRLKRFGIYENSINHLRKIINQTLKNAGL